MNVSNLLRRRAVTGTLGSLALAVTFFLAMRGGLSVVAGMPQLDAAIHAGLLAFLAWTVAMLTAFTARDAAQGGVWVYGSALVCAVFGWACTGAGSVAA